MTSGTPLVDRSLICAECGAPFDFSVAEQAFYAERGIGQPACCRECRAKNRAARNADLIAAYEALGETADWHDSAVTYGGHRERERSEGGRRVRVNGDGSAGAKVNFRATCARCGRTTEVPFEPRSGRPVYCRACFNHRHRRGR